ncbi:MAG: Nif3-like dinuclear metal center hexameric protein [Pyrinomonadaceae bacterium]|nr:Nif3-like dinuclear metal center hexameric protein [Pyrinomonadaceae bacterium]
MISLNELAEFLDRFFAMHLYQDDQGGVYCASPRPVRRLGVALEPWLQLGTWVRDQRLDALFLHRPWQLDPQQLAGDVGVVAYHHAFDERLTLGWNLRLAEAMELSQVEVLGHKDDRPLGMIGEVRAQSFATFRLRIAQTFGGEEQTRLYDKGEITRVAVVGAMTELLVGEAWHRGAQVYVTGQWRKPAGRAVAENGIGVIVVGHRRSEEWGLRALAGVIRERWAEVEVVLPQSHE